MALMDNGQPTETVKLSVLHNSAQNHLAQIGQPLNSNTRVVVLWFIHLNGLDGFQFLTVVNLEIYHLPLSQFQTSLSKALLFKALHQPNAEFNKIFNHKFLGYYFE